MPENESRSGAAEVSAKRPEDGGAPAYEAPRLVAIGSLHDLLAGFGSLTGDVVCKTPAKLNPSC
jgi:hypothetical protein